MARIEIDQLSKTYPNGFEALKEFSLDVADGEFLVLVGPSGCGKSTALRMVAGLEKITGGELRIDGRSVNTVASKNRDIAMVFQSYALYPHMTVYQNIGFSLKMSKVPKAEADKMIRSAAAVLELDEMLDRKPGQLSGGQRQRVAMGRAIVREPALFLMDEPLSNLDAKLRVQMRAEIARLQKDIGVTTIYVTHDQVEAMTMGDRVAVMKDGVLQQVANPKTLYDNPVNMFVGAFIGSPSMALLEAKVTPGSIRIGSLELKVSNAELEKRPFLKEWENRDLIVGIRPEALEDAELSGVTGRGTEFEAAVELVEELGSDIIVHLGFDGKRVDAGDPDSIKELSQETTNILARFDRRSGVTEGGTARVRVDLDDLHFFDPESGLRLS